MSSNFLAYLQGFRFSCWDHFQVLFLIDFHFLIRFNTFWFLLLLELIFQFQLILISPILVFPRLILFMRVQINQPKVEGCWLFLRYFYSVNVIDRLLSVNLSLFLDAFIFYYSTHEFRSLNCFLRFTQRQLSFKVVAANFQLFIMICSIFHFHVVI